MLKKAAIIVATAAVALVTVSSFAFADETVTKDNLTNDCTFGAVGPDVTSSLTGGSGVAAVVNGLISAIAPVTTQAQALNCLNADVEDVADIDSNNKTKDVTKTDIEDSFND